MLTVGNGVALFTLDRKMGSWVLMEENLSIPDDAQKCAPNCTSV